MVDQFEYRDGVHRRFDSADPDDRRPPPKRGAVGHEAATLTTSAAPVWKGIESTGPFGLSWGQFLLGEPGAVSAGQEEAQSRMAGLTFVFELVALVISVVALIAFLRGAQGLPMPPEHRPKHHRPVAGLSVVLILDEDAAPAHSTAALLAETYRNLDIIVVPCGARLGERAKQQLRDDPRARLVEATPPPVGWMRRAHAFDTGFRRARHDFILFLDGTVLLRTDGLERAVRMAKQRGAGVLTIFPEMTATTWAERLLIPFFMQLTLTGVSFRKINDPDHPAAGGFAPFFLFRRATYEAAGGYAAFRSDRSADSALLHRVKEVRHRLIVGDGTELAVLVGQDTFPAIWQSWSRSFNEAIGNDTRQAVMFAALVFTLFAAPWLVLSAAVAMSVSSVQTLAGSPWVGALLMGIGVVVVSVAHRRSLRNILKIDDSLVWLQPLAASITALMIVASSMNLEERLKRFSESTIPTSG